MGLQARLMSQALRKLSGAIQQSRTAMIFTNQLRMKIGVMFGNPETTSGGRALRFYASVRLDMRRVQSIKHQGEVIGIHTRVRVTKNKVAPPFKTAEFDIMYNEGISRWSDLLDVAVELGAVDKRGSWYSYGDLSLGQGRIGAQTFLRQNPKLADDIEVHVREMAALRPMGRPTEAEVAEGVVPE